MPVREFEMFHGAVLTKLVRGDRPLTLRLIETRPEDSWSTYRVNDEVGVLVKHSVRPRTLKREEGAVAWQFVFSAEQMEQLRQPETWVALVCGSTNFGARDMEVCLLAPSQVATLTDLTDGGQQSVTVKRLPGRSLRVGSARAAEALVVPRNRLDDWSVPGS